MKSISKLAVILIFLFITNLVFSQEIEVDPELEQAPSLITNNDTLQITDSGEVFVFVEDQPSFPGGDKAQLKYFQENNQYPKEAKDAGIQGLVYVTFVVEKDGRITNVKVLRGLGGGLDKEAVRLTKNMPRWKPGRQRGELVRVQYIMPIRFVIYEFN